MIETGNIVIPIEILTMIFEMLPQKEQINLRCVCKAFKLVFDDGFYLKGFRFKKRDVYYKYIDYFRYYDEHYSKQPVIKTFKIRKLTFENFQKRYKLEDLTFLNPNAVKILKLKGTIRSNNFSMIMDQLTNLSELYLSGKILDSLRHFHLANLKFGSLKILRIIQYSCKRLEKLKIFLTENEFPKLNNFEIIAGLRPINQKKDNYLILELTLFSFLKKCQKTIKKFLLMPLENYGSSRNNDNLDSVKNDANLNLDNYKINCPNLRFFEFHNTRNIKVVPWLAFLEKNFENLQSFVWKGENNLKEHEAIYNLLKTKNAPFLENLEWISSISLSLAFVDFKILKGFGVLKYLNIQDIDTSHFGYGNGNIEVNKTFNNLRLISHFSPNLEYLIIGKGCIDSDSIDLLLTGQNLQALKYIKFKSKWKSGNGLRVDTYKKVIEENKIEQLWLFDCVNNESFADPANREYLNSKLGQNRMSLMLHRIQSGFSNNLHYNRDENTNDNVGYHYNNY